MLALALAGAGEAQADSMTFKFTGFEQAFTVPARVTSLHVDATGAHGGGGESGFGQGGADGGFGATATSESSSTDATGIPLLKITYTFGGNNSNSGLKFGKPKLNKRKGTAASPRRSRRHLQADQRRRGRRFEDDQAEEELTRSHEARQPGFEPGFPD